MILSIILASTASGMSETVTQLNALTLTSPAPELVEIRDSARRAGWIWAEPPKHRDESRGRVFSPKYLLSVLLGWYAGACATVLWGPPFLTWLIGPVSAGLVIYFATAEPARTRSGERALVEAQDRYRSLTVRTWTDATVFVALGGLAALQTLDPDFVRRAQLSVLVLPPADQLTGWRTLQTWTARHGRRSV